MTRSPAYETSISILAPCTYKTKTSKAESDDRAPEEEAGQERGGERRVLRGFRIAHVFDIAQTDGDGVQPPARPELLDGDAPAGLWDTLAHQIEAAGYTLNRGVIPSGANGTTNFAARTVTVADHLAAAQATKTLAHD